MPEFVFAPRAGQESRLRKFSLLVAGVLLAGGTLAACIGGPPPPPPTDPHDVLVVGDSVSFAFGCVLGDAGNSGNPCPANPDFSTQHDFSGACTIAPGTLVLYNGGFAPAPSCDTVPAAANGRTWEQAANQFTPKVAIIVTAGWEIVDRYFNSGSAPPDAQWAGPNGTDQTAAAVYSNQLLNAINMFRSKGAKVLIANAPYIDPPTPLPDPTGTPADCMWWEPDDTSPPVSQGPCQQGQQWRSPPGSGVGYRSSHAKLNQFNDVVNIVKNNFFQNDADVRVVNFRERFNLAPNANAYTDYVCPPPNDSTVAPDPVTHNCVITNPSPGVVPAILARAPDKGHLSSGRFDILKFYLEPCVRALIPVSGGDLSKCS